GRRARRSDRTGSPLPSSPPKPPCIDLHASVALRAHLRPRSLVMLAVGRRLGVPAGHLPGTPRGQGPAPEGSGGRGYRRPLDAEGLKNEALSAISGASALAELEDARVRFLGRKSELARALREVRDRETGMVLNGVRDALEAAVSQRRRSIERAEL